jgi:hypothetical protein
MLRTYHIAHTFIYFFIDMCLHSNFLHPNVSWSEFQEYSLFATYRLYKPSYLKSYAYMHVNLCGSHSTALK